MCVRERENVRGREFHQISISLGKEDSQLGFIYINYHRVIPRPRDVEVLEFKEVLLSPKTGRSIDLCLPSWLGSTVLGPNNDKSHQLNSSSIVYKVPLFANFFLSVFLSCFTTRIFQALSNLELFYWSFINTLGNSLGRYGNDHFKLHFGFITSFLIFKNLFIIKYSNQAWFVILVYFLFVSY